MDKVVCVAPTSCLLGEGPLWSPTDGYLWWVDIKRAKLHRHNPRTGNTRRYDLPIHTSAMAMWQGELLMVGDHEVGIYDSATEEYRRMASLPNEPESNRTNDGGIAPDGSFWFGTMDKRGEEATGRYYCLGRDGQIQHLGLDAVPVTNTFEFSPDGRTFYTSDSAAQEILAFDHDVESGVLTERRVFASTAQAGCYPDGSAMDAEGYLWNAQWAGSRVVRYAPDGAIDRIVPLPVSRPTSCAFGGADLKTLYITSARTGLSDRALDRQPFAGCLFALDVETPGLAIGDWGGKL